MKKPAENRGEFSMVFWFHPLAVFVIIADVGLAVLKSNFARQFLVTTILVDFHSTK